MNNSYELKYHLVLVDYIQRHFNPETDNDNKIRELERLFQHGILLDSKLMETPKHLMEA